MRITSVILLSALTSACAIADSNDPPPAPAASVRERLETPTRLWIGPTDAAGAITAERKVGQGWQGSAVDLGVENGELIVGTGEANALSIDGLQITFAPLTLPEGLFGGKTAELTHVRIDLAGAHDVAATWTSDDEVHVTAMLDLTLSWTLELDGAPAPLGSPELPPVPVEITLTGDGDHVDAELGVHAAGELWNWAGLVKLAELQLSVVASI